MAELIWSTVVVPRTVNLIAAVVIASFAGGQMCAQESTPTEKISYGESIEQSAPDIIFSNLDKSSNNRYNSDPFEEQRVSGKRAPLETEQWIAFRFVPRTDAQVTVLMAAIGYESGTKRVNLGIYNDNGSGTVGDLIPGGQATATRIPDSGTCCQLAKVTLPGSGVLLTAGTPYWLVASPDNISGSDFFGGWRVANDGAQAGIEPPAGWVNHASYWPAAEIRGTKLQGESQRKSINSNDAGASSRDGHVTIFNNLDKDSLGRYINSGSLVTGNNVPFVAEVWTALPFTPKENSHATRLKAAIGWFSGTKKVKLGLYTDNAGIVGTVLPGGESSTTNIPAFDDCCDLATVNLPGSGVALSAGIQYWLVASPDDVDAPDFYGGWHDTTVAITAYKQPKHGIPWTSFSGNWLAAEIDGTSP